MKDKISEIIGKIAEEQDVWLENVSFTDAPDNRILVVLDTEKGISFKTLAAVNRRIRDDEDFIAAGGDDFELELSSPGIDAPLTLLRHFKKNIGRNLKIEHRREEIPSPAVVELIGADEDGITIRSGKKKKTAEINFSYEDITQAKVKLKW